MSALLLLADKFGAARRCLSPGFDITGADAVGAENSSLVKTLGRSRDPGKGNIIRIDHTEEILGAVNVGKGASEPAVLLLGDVNGFFPPFPIPLDFGHGEVLADPCADQIWNLCLCRIAGVLVQQQRSNANTDGQGQ